MQVSDIMTRDVTTVAPDATIADAAKIFAQQGISGAPVLAGDGQVVGMLTEGDLLPQPKRIGLSRLQLPSLFGEHIGGASLDELFRQAGDRRVDEVMETEVISGRADETVAEAASRMSAHGVKRLPILDDGRLVGVLSRQDILRALAASC